MFTFWSSARKRSLHCCSETTEVCDDAKAIMNPAFIYYVQSPTKYLVQWFGVSIDYGRVSKPWEHSLSFDAPVACPLDELVMSGVRPSRISDNSFYRSATSKRATGTQSLSSNTKWIPGNKKTSSAHELSNQPSLTRHRLCPFYAEPRRSTSLWLPLGPICRTSLLILGGQCPIGSVLTSSAWRSL